MTAQIKTFQKDSDNLEEYEEQIKNGLEIAKNKDLIPMEIRNIIWHKVQQETKQQKEFIKRNDMINFYKNMIKISSDNKLINIYKKETKILKGKDISTAYEYISVAEDIIQEENKNQKKQHKQKKEKENIERLKKEEKQEKEKIKDLEKLLDDID